MRGRRQRTKHCEKGRKRRDRGAELAPTCSGRTTGTFVVVVFIFIGVPTLEWARPVPKFFFSFFLAVYLFLPPFFFSFFLLIPDYPSPSRTLPKTDSSLLRSEGSSWPSLMTFPESNIEIGWLAPKKIRDLRNIRTFSACRIYTFLYNLNNIIFNRSILYYKIKVK